MGNTTVRDFTQSGAFLVGIAAVALGIMTYALPTWPMLGMVVAISATVVANTVWYRIIDVFNYGGSLALVASDAIVIGGLLIGVGMREHATIMFIVSGLVAVTFVGCCFLILTNEGHASALLTLDSDNLKETSTEPVIETVHPLLLGFFFLLQFMIVYAVTTTAQLSPRWTTLGGILVAGLTFAITYTYERSRVEEDEDPSETP